MFYLAFVFYVSLQQWARQSALQASLYHHFYLMQKGPWLHLHYMFLWLRNSHISCDCLAFAFFNLALTDITSHPVYLPREILREPSNRLNFHYPLHARNLEVGKNRTKWQELSVLDTDHRVDRRLELKVQIIHITI